MLETYQDATQAYADGVEKLRRQMGSGPCTRRTSPPRSIPHWVSITRRSATMIRSGADLSISRQMNRTLELRSQSYSIDDKKRLSYSNSLESRLRNMLMSQPGI